MPKEPTNEQVIALALAQYRVMSAAYDYCEQLRKQIMELIDCENMADQVRTAFAALVPDITELLTPKPTVAVDYQPLYDTLSGTLQSITSLQAQIAAAKPAAPAPGEAPAPDSPIVADGPVIESDPSVSAPAIQ